MKIEPLGDYVLIEQDAAKAALDSGIILPTEVDTPPPPTGVIYASSTENLPAGTKVLFKPHMFDELVLEKKEFKVGSSQHVVAKLC